MAPDNPAPLSLYQETDQASLSPDSRFRFHCHGGLACFNRCCRAPTILLSPYDILQLKNFLSLTSGEFLARYTVPVTEELGDLPLVFMDAFRSESGGCPFLGPQGCTVYPRRPAACRLFPITMGSQLTAQGVVDYNFCRRLDYCQGFDAETEWTVASWKESQGFGEYEEGRRPWLELLLKLGLQRPRPRAPEVQARLAAIAYDLDQFRAMLSAPDFPLAPDLAGEWREELLRDEMALLKFSYRYLQSLLLGE